MLLQTHVYPCIPRTGLFHTHKQQTIVLTDSKIKKINLKKITCLYIDASFRNKDYQVATFPESSRKGQIRAS